MRKERADLCGSTKNSTGFNKFAVFIFLIIVSVFFNPLILLAADDIVGAGSKPVLRAGLEPTPTLNATLNDENVCITCHSKLGKPMRVPVTEWQESVHKKAGVNCVDCHGGNPLSVKLAMEKVSGFLGKPLREEIPELCGKCHSDNQRMRKYNLKTDQLQVYKTSIHGKKLFENGDENVATCVDCHNAHGVKSKHDPTSPTYRFNIPATCAKCHSDADMMEGYNMPYNQLDLYKYSVHGKKLLKEQHLFVPTCVDCHGEHGISKPGVKEKFLICGTCHSEVAEQFRKSPHWSSDTSTDKINCTDCHNSHDIKKTGVNKFTGFTKNDCGGCHEKGSDGFTVGEKIKTIITNTGNAIVKGQQNLDTLLDLRKNSFELATLEKQLETAKTKMAKIPLITHTLSLPVISKELDEIGSLISAIEAETADKLSELKKRKFFLAITWVLIVIVIFLLRKILKTISYD